MFMYVRRDGRVYESSLRLVPKNTSDECLEQLKRKCMYEYKKKNRIYWPTEELLLCFCVHILKQLFRNIFIDFLDPSSIYKTAVGHSRKLRTRSSALSYYNRFTFKHWKRRVLKYTFSFETYPQQFDTLLRL